MEKTSCCRLILCLIVLVGLSSHAFVRPVTSTSCSSNEQCAKIHPCKAGLTSLCHYGQCKCALVPFATQAPVRPVTSAGCSSREGCKTFPCKGETTPACLDGQYCGCILRGPFASQDKKCAKSSDCDDVCKGHLKGMCLSDGTCACLSS